MKKILLPTDFSENAENAIAYAQQLFEKEACMFFILHAYHGVPSAPTNKKDMESNLHESIKALRAKNKNKEHGFEGIILTDSVVNAINITFIDKGIDFVVIGTQGSSALREVVLGSNTVSVIKYMERCPVIVVPTEYKFHIPKKVVFATDYKHTFAMHELHPLIAFSKLWLSKITIAHIAVKAVLTGTQTANKEILNKSLGEIEHDFLNLEKETSLAETLLSLERGDRQIGLVAMMRTKHGIFQTLFREPVIKKMAFQSKIPFLVLALLK